MFERYQRHSLIDWFSQDVLARTKVIVIGAGAVGNEVIKNLTLLGVGEIHIFDLDMIEEHNLTRSVLFREEQVGRPKAEVAAQQAMNMDPNVLVTGTKGDFWNKLSFSELRRSDVVFCCVDNFEARIRSNTLCYLAGVDLVNIGIDSRFALVEIFPFSRRELTACLECNFPETVYRRIAERYSCGHLRKLSFIEQKMPTTIVTSAIAASFAVSLGLRLGEPSEQGPEARRLYVDTIGGTLTNITLDRLEGCPCCGRLPLGPSIVTSTSLLEEWRNEWGDVIVHTSEPILASYRVNGTETVVFEKAANFSSDFPASVASDPGDTELEVRDQFSIKELTERFAGRSMPCKFAVITSGIKSLVFEFTEGLA